MNETAQTIITAIKPIADKIGQGAQHLYEIYVKQQYISGINELIFGCGMGLVLLITGVVVFRLGLKSSQNDKYEYDDWPLGIMIAGPIVGLLGLILIVAFGSDGIQHIINPEYFAIEDIIHAVTGNGGN